MSDRDGHRAGLQIDCFAIRTYRTIQNLHFANLRGQHERQDTTPRETRIRKCEANIQGTTNESASMRASADANHGTRTVSKRQDAAREETTEASTLVWKCLQYLEDQTSVSLSE